MPPIQEFYRHEVMRETVKQFFIETLQDMAVEKTFAGEETHGIKDAKDCIDKSFERLDNEFGEKVKQIINNSK